MVFHRCHFPLTLLDLLCRVWLAPVRSDSPPQSSAYYPRAPSHLALPSLLDRPPAKSEINGEQFKGAHRLALATCLSEHVAALVSLGIVQTTSMCSTVSPPSRGSSASVVRGSQSWFAVHRPRGLS